MADGGLSLRHPPPQSRNQAPRRIFLLVPRGLRRRSAFWRQAACLDTTADCVPLTPSAQHPEADPAQGGDDHDPPGRHLPGHQQNEAG